VPVHREDQGRNKDCEESWEWVGPELGNGNRCNEAVNKGAEEKPNWLVAEVLVLEVPVDVLTLPAAVVRPQTPHALPPGPPLAETAQGGSERAKELKIMLV